MPAAFKCADGCGDDNASAAPLVNHLLCRCFGTEKRALEIDGDNIHKFLLRLLQQREDCTANARIGNENIHAAKKVYSLGNQPVHLRALGNVNWNYVDPPAVSSYDFGSFLGSSLGNIRSYHIGTVGGEQHGGSLTDAASGTGNDRSFSGAVKGGNLNRVHDIASLSYRQRPLSVTMA